MASSIPPDSPAPWRELLASCRVAQQVVTLANEYVSRLPEEELMRLPEECRPRFFRNGSDLNEYAVDLKACRCGLREARVVEKLAAFFQDAAQRLSVLTGPHRHLGASLWNPPASNP